MNKRVILIALTAVMLSTVSYAQKVIREGNALIIDCSEMDPKFYVSEKKKPTESSDLSSDKKVYKKFEVHKTLSGTMEGSKARDFCANTTLNGSTGWRLPTLRELMLIWILKEKLEANGATLSSPKNSSCLSATIFVTNSYWGMNLSDGSVGPIHTIYPVYVRCIRDI